MTGQLGPDDQRRGAKFQSIHPMYDVVFLPMRLDDNIISNSCSYSISCKGGRGGGGWRCRDSGVEGSDRLADTRIGGDGK